MTTDEELLQCVQARLNSPGGREKIASEFGGGDEWKTAEDLLRQVNRKPGMKDRLCSYFGILTDADKMVRASIETADAETRAAAAAEASARHAKKANELAQGANILAEKANTLSILAVVLAALALIASIASIVIPLLRNPRPLP